MGITFTDSAKGFILDALDMAIDKTGFIVYKGTNKEVLTKDGNNVHITQFAGIHKDYGLIRNDLNSIVAFSDYMKKHNKEV